MEMIGEPLNEAQLEQLLAIADLDQDGRINYEGECSRRQRTLLTQMSVRKDMRVYQRNESEIEQD